MSLADQLSNEGVTMKITPAGLSSLHTLLRNPMGLRTCSMLSAEMIVSKDPSGKDTLSIVPVTTDSSPRSAFALIAAHGEIHSGDLETTRFGFSEKIPAAAPDFEKSAHIAACIFSQSVKIT
jgi:hypothetical protein